MSLIMFEVMFNDTMTSKCKQKEAKQAETSKSKQKQAENKQKQIGWREESLAEADGLMWCSELQEIPVESCVVLEFALASLDNIYTWIPWKLVLPSPFYFMKNSFSDMSRKWILPSMIRAVPALIYSIRYDSHQYQKISFFMK